MMARARKSLYLPLVMKLDGIMAEYVERHLADEERRLVEMQRHLGTHIKDLRRARCYLIKAKRKARRKKHADELQKSARRADGSAVRGVPR